MTWNTNNFNKDDVGILDYNTDFGKVFLEQTKKMKKRTTGICTTCVRFSCLEYFTAICVVCFRGIDSDVPLEYR